MLRGGARRFIGDLWIPLGQIITCRFSLWFLNPPPAVTVTSPLILSGSGSALTCWYVWRKHTSRVPPTADPCCLLPPPLSEEAEAFEHDLSVEPLCGGGCWYKEYFQMHFIEITFGWRYCHQCANMPFFSPFDQLFCRRRTWTRAVQDSM